MNDRPLEGSPLKLSELQDHGIILYPYNPRFRGTLIECVVCENSWFVRDCGNPDFIVTRWVCPSSCNKEG